MNRRDILRAATAAPAVALMQIAPAEPATPSIEWLPGTAQSPFSSLMRREIEALSQTDEYRVWGNWYSPYRYRPHAPKFRVYHRTMFDFDDNGAEKKSIGLMVSDEISPGDFVFLFSSRFMKKDGRIALRGLMLRDTMEHYPFHGSPIKDRFRLDVDAIFGRRT